MHYIKRPTVNPKYFDCFIGNLRLEKVKNKNKQMFLLTIFN